MSKVCNACGSKAQGTITQAAYECAMARADRQHRRMWILALVLIAALIASNVAWIIYESQYETISQTCEEYNIDQQCDNGGINNATIINGGNINNGTTNGTVQKDNH